MSRLTYEVLYHAQRYLVLADDAVPHRTYRDYVARRPAEHLLRLASDLQYPVRIFIYRNDRRLLDDDPLALYVDKHRRRAEVDPYILLKHPPYSLLRSSPTRA